MKRFMSVIDWIEDGLFASECDWYDCTYDLSAVPRSPNVARWCAWKNGSVAVASVASNFLAGSEAEVWAGVWLHASPNERFLPEKQTVRYAVLGVVVWTGSAPRHAGALGRGRGDCAV